VATVIFDKRKFTAATAFLIRGLASNGRDYASGGPETLTTWVSDPRPLPKEMLHYCAWVKTPDGLGVGGVRVRFLLRYSGKSQAWTSGPTNKDGIACTRRAVAPAAVGRTVVLDAYTGSLHAQTHFNPAS
jgi:hypothetical protein